MAGWEIPVLNDRDKISKNHEDTPGIIRDPWGSTKLLKLMNSCWMTTSSKIIYNKTDSDLYTVSYNKVIIETHEAVRWYYKCHKRIIENTTTTVTIKAMPKLTWI